MSAPLQPSRRVRAGAYRVPRALAPADLMLDANEGPCPDLDLLRNVQPDTLRRYPDAGALTALLAKRFGIADAQVLVTAGADDALDRACRAVLEPGSTVVWPVPGFEMVERYARACDATVVRLPWRGALTVDDIVGACACPAMVVLTSPNNPTGAVVQAEMLRELSARLPSTLLLVDLAYAEFADDDLSQVALSLPNALVVRTLSKAWGLAGLRVGFAMGAAETIWWLASVGAPFAVSSVSMAVAGEALERREGAMADHVAQVRRNRARLEDVLTELGAVVWPSQANFVFAEVDDPLWLRDAMAGMGIAIRAWESRPELARAVRIGVPEHPSELQRLEEALWTVFRPAALLLDMDGVVVDVAESYRAAIVGAASDFGVAVVPADIEACKALGNANDDWAVTWRLVQAQGVDASYEAVKEAFEARYQGGLWKRERLLCDPELLPRLAGRIRLGVVTGRPRRDAERFLDSVGLSWLISALVCREDAPSKPDPAPVRLAMERLGVRRAWMVGDTPDDAAAARAAGVLPLGVGSTKGQILAGAARVLPNLDAVEGLL
jgi:histidinol-phosphate aminotransferase